MELPVALQARQFLLSLALGAALGTVYDVARVIRRRRPHLTLPLDLLFGAILLLSLLLFSLTVGEGLLRLFFLPGVGLGAAVYFGTLSGAVCCLFDEVFRFFYRLLRGLLFPLRFFLEKTVVFCKKCFAICEKWYTMCFINGERRRARKRGGIPYAKQILVHRHQGDGSGSGFVRRVYPGESAGRDQAQGTAGRRAESRHRRHQTGHPTHSGKHRRHRDRRTHAAGRA
ncbi:MAG: spore cortex biosynthesis protein YabQ [Oscillospiraceae bacterium]|nr:spore cortex biosynthesis protein YabQ [Oscillospiraceae bacterium]MBR2081048.1 spore cortex biosynthesis protein YabQ [Oscillospiraceae bacterium]MBR2365765.1 spore cortex biosynthesis protein YabQ [Oscillospiraceae bacterium]MBR2978014.1 spore cortex biosynthesis protein YabQ [Oscillospiraceae bacterium]